MQIPIVSGIYATQAGELRTAYPRNLTPVPKSQGVSQGYLRPAWGLEQMGTAPGPCRGGILWDGVVYRVFGTKFCSVAADGALTVIGDVMGASPVTMDYGFDRLAIASGGKLWYYDKATLQQVTDPDLGRVLDVRWIAGYFVTTDGTSIITTELSNPRSVNPLHYGSAEADPDPVMAVDELRNELYAFGRYTVEVLQNVGGANFPFRRIEGAGVAKGIVGTHAYCGLGETFALLGGGRNEAPAVYIMVPGDLTKVSTSEIDTILAGYTDEQLAGVVMETQVDRGHQHVFVHLPDQTLVYDTIGSQAAQAPLWHVLTSSVAGLGQYRGRYLVQTSGTWTVADPVGTAYGRLTRDTMKHWGQAIGWDFSVPVLYNNGADGILHDLELVAVPGMAALGDEPVIWTQYSHDGQAWSLERPTRAGSSGQGLQRIAWRGNGRLRHWRVQRFRGTSDARVPVMRLEAQIEPLANKGPYG